MNGDSHRELDTIELCEATIGVGQGAQYLEASEHGPLGVVLMRRGPAKVDEESIAEQLGNMAVIALDHLGAGGLVRPHHVAVVFRVEALGQLGRLDQVTEHNGEVTPLGFRRRRHLENLRRQRVYRSAG